MVKVSHEVPMCLLEKSKEFNDYQYGLVHLLEVNGVNLKWITNMH